MYDHPASLDDGYSDEVLPLFVNWCRDRGVELFLGVEYLIYYGSPDSMWPAEVTCKQYVCHDPDVPVAGNANLWGFYSGSLQFVPCLKDFESHPDGPEALFSDVVHLTEKGADLLARVISDYVKSNWAEISKTLYDDRQPSGLLQGLESMNPGKDSESARINER